MVVGDDVWEWKRLGVCAPRASPLRGSGAAAARGDTAALGAQVERGPGQGVRAPAAGRLHGLAADRRDLPLALSSKNEKWTKES